MTYQIVSSHSAVLRDARELSGRNPNTGEIVDAARLGSWPAAICYLIALDQFGTVFGSTDVESTFPQSFHKALDSFTGLTEDEIEALYALRCSLAHDYSLLNRHRNQKRQHVFHLIPDGSGSAVQLPATPWDGSLADISQASLTVINLRVVGDLVESVAQTITAADATGSLRRNLADDEARARYRFAILTPAAGSDEACSR
jgi:hypothetical protein